MIFTLFAVLTGAYAFFKWKERGEVNWIFWLLTLLLASVDLYFLFLSSDIKNFYGISGTAGSGLTFAKTVINGNSSTTQTFTYLDWRDMKVGEFIGYRNAEAQIMTLFGSYLWGLLLLALGYYVWEGVKSTGLVPE